MCQRPRPSLLARSLGTENSMGLGEVSDGREGFPGLLSASRQFAPDRHRCKVRALDLPMREARSQLGREIGLWITVSDTWFEVVWKFRPAFPGW